MPLTWSQHPSDCCEHFSLVWCGLGTSNILLKLHLPLKFLHMKCAFTVPIWFDIYSTDNIRASIVNILQIHHNSDCLIGYTAMFRSCSHVLLCLVHGGCFPNLWKCLYYEIQIKDYMKIIVTYLVNTVTFPYLMWIMLCIRLHWSCTAFLLSFWILLCRVWCTDWMISYNLILLWGFIKILRESELHKQLFSEDQIHVEVGPVIEDFFQLAQDLHFLNMRVYYSIVKD